MPALIMKSTRGGEPCPGAGRGGRGSAKRGGTGKPSAWMVCEGKPAARITAALSSFGTRKVSLAQRCQTELIVMESVTMV